MTQRGEQAMQQLQDDLACPQCEYNLRGLFGEEVNCPECGQHINIARLVADRWTKPWWHAPLYNTLAVPLAWALFCLFALLPVMIFSMERTPRLEWIPLVYIAVAFLGWLGMMVLVRWRFGGDEAIGLALLLHAVLPMYVLGLFATIGFGIRLVFYDLGRFPWTMAMIDMIFIALSVGSIILARFIERFVGRRCIKRYLRLTAEGKG